MGLIQTAGQNSDGSITLGIEGKPAYRYCLEQVSILGPPSTDTLVIQGSATRTVKIRFLRLTLETNAGGGVWPGALARRQTGWSGGTSSVIPGVPLDPAFPAATAVVRWYTAAGTMGALSGFMAFERMPCNGAGVVPRHTVFEAGTRMNKPIILRGIDDWVTLYNWGVSPPGGSEFASIELELEEDNS